MHGLIMQSCIRQSAPETSRARFPTESRFENPGWQIKLPVDLLEWVDESTLLVWLEQEILRLDWHHPLVQSYLREHPDYHPKVMLSVLAFGYLTRSFSSESIAEACRTEKAFRVLCQGTLPFAHELVAFRKKNRAVVERVVTGVFLRAICHKFDLNHADLPAELEHDIRRRAVERLNIARHMDVLDT